MLPPWLLFDIVILGYILKFAIKKIYYIKREVSNCLNLTNTQFSDIIFL